MNIKMLNSIIEDIFGITAATVTISEGMFYVWIDNPHIKLLELEKLGWFVDDISIEWRNDGFGLYFSYDINN